MIAAWLALPHWVKVAALGAIAAIALLTLHKCSVQDAVDADRAQTGARAQEKARDADTAARGEMEGVQDEVEETNQQARDAAACSDDPLRAAFDRLRGEAPGPCSAAGGADALR